MKRKEVIDWERVVFFSGNGNPILGKKILVKLTEQAGRTCKFSHINFSEFADKERDDKIPDCRNLKDKVVVFYQSVTADEFQLEFSELVWAIKHQYQAKYVIAVMPFMRYRRQDHPEIFEEINRNLMFIDQMKHDGVDYLIVATPHSDQTEKNCQAVGLRFRQADPSWIFFRTLWTILPPPAENRTRVYAPDQGSIPRAIKLAELLKVDVIFSLKKRGLNNLTSIVAADRQEIKRIKKQYAFFPRLNYATADLVKDAAIVMVEDEISSGSTANDTGQLLRSLGADEIHLAATHPVCVLGWKRKLLSKNPFDKIVITDTIFRDNKQRTGGLMHDVSMSSQLTSELFGALREVFTEGLV